jgi:hypothetical protein
MTIYGQYTGEQVLPMRVKPEMTAFVLPEDEDLLAAYFIGQGRIAGDIISPTVPYEDYTFDENNLFPEEWAAKQAASHKKD